MINIKRTARNNIKKDKIDLIKKIDISNDPGR